MASYDAELLGVALAALIIKHSGVQLSEKVKIHTDCQGIVTKIKKIQQNITYALNESEDENQFSHQEDVESHREGLKNNILIKTILSESKKISLIHQPAHVERRKSRISAYTIEEMGNYIADSIAGNRDHLVQNIVQSVTIIPISLTEIKRLTAINTPISIHQQIEGNKPGATFEGSANKLQQHVCRNRFSKYLPKRGSNFFGHLRIWDKICFETAGRALATFKQETYNSLKNKHDISQHQLQKMFYLLTNDKLMNMYTMFKYTQSTATNEIDSEDGIDDNPINQLLQSVNEMNANIMRYNNTISSGSPGQSSNEEAPEMTEELLRKACGDQIDLIPSCPCCATLTPHGHLPLKDSTSHLLFDCQQDTIAQARKAVINYLYESSAQLERHLRAPYCQLIDSLYPNKNNLRENDSRRWGGAFHFDLLNGLSTQEGKPLSTREVRNLVAKIQKSTLPAAHFMWKTYCTIAHKDLKAANPFSNKPANLPKSPSKSKRQTLLSRNSTDNRMYAYLPKYDIPTCRERKAKKKSIQITPANQLLLPTFFHSKRPMTQTDIPAIQPAKLMKHSNKQLRDHQSNPQSGIINCWLQSGRIPKTSSHPPLPPQHANPKSPQAPLPYTEPEAIKQFTEYRKQQSRTIANNRQQAEKTQQRVKTDQERRLQNRQKKIQETEYARLRFIRRAQSATNATAPPTTAPSSQPSTNITDQSSYFEGFTFTRTRNTISRRTIIQNHELSEDDRVKIVERITNATATNVAGDGLCLIHAINEARNPLPGIPKETAREKIISFYTETAIGQEAISSSGSDLQELISRLRTQWLDDDAIQALTHILQCNIGL